MDFFQMGIAGGIVSELKIADRALVSRNISMDNCVNSSSLGILELSPTLPTLELTFAMVGGEVTPEIIYGFECFTALWAW